MGAVILFFIYFLFQRIPLLFPCFISRLIPSLLLSPHFSSFHLLSLHSFSLFPSHTNSDPSCNLSPVSSSCTLQLFSYHSSPWNVLQPGNCAFLVRVCVCMQYVFVDLFVCREHRQRIHFHRGCPLWLLCVVDA